MIKLFIFIQFCITFDVIKGQPKNVRNFDLNLPPPPVDDVEDDDPQEMMLSTMYVRGSNEQEWIPDRTMDMQIKNIFYYFAKKHNSAAEKDQKWKKIYFPKIGNLQILHMPFKNLDAFLFYFIKFFKNNFCHFLLVYIKRATYVWQMLGPRFKIGYK